MSKSLRMTWAALPLPTWLRWLGAAIGLAMLPLLYWVFRSIGSNISETTLTKEKHQLVMHGPFQWLRHPLYSAATMVLVSMSMLAADWFMFMMACIAVIGVAVLVIPREEAELIRKFGVELPGLHAAHRAIGSASVPVGCKKRRLTRCWRRTAALRFRSMPGGHADAPFTLKIAFPAAVAQLCVRQYEKDHLHSCLGSCRFEHCSFPHGGCDLCRGAAAGGPLRDKVTLPCGVHDQRSAGFGFDCFGCFWLASRHPFAAQRPQMSRHTSVTIDTSVNPEWRLDKAQQNGAFLRKWPQMLVGGSRKPGSTPCQPRFPRAGWVSTEAKKNQGGLRPTRGHPGATLRPPDGQPVGTLKLPGGYPEATLRLPWDYGWATSIAGP